MSKVIWYIAPNRERPAVDKLARLNPQLSEAQAVERWARERIGDWITYTLESTYEVEQCTRDSFVIQLPTTAAAEHFMRVMGGHPHDSAS